MAKYWWLFLLLILLLVIQPVEAEYKKIWVKSITGLDFGFVYPGQGPLVIDPKRPTPNTFPAEVIIRGHEWMPFQIILPEDITIKSGQFTIPVTNFTSNLPDDIGYFDADGETVFRLGATLGPIPVNARSGRYQGRAVLTVYYAY